MQTKTEGVVLRTVKYGESQIIVDILTKDLGMQTYMIYGARSARSKKKGLYSIPNMLQLDVVHQENKSIQKIQDQVLIHPYKSLHFDFMKMSTAVFIAELTSKVLSKSDVSPGTYEFVKRYFIHLDQFEGNIALIHLHYMVHWTGDHGFEFQTQEGDWFPFFDMEQGRFVPQEPVHNAYLSNDTLELFKNLLGTRVEELHTILSNRTQRNLLLDRLLYYYRYNIDGLPEMKTYQVLRDIL